MPEPVLSLKNLKKTFSGNEILRGVSLDVYKGEFITLLGASGCGKTTTLRAISGLERVDSGQILLGGKDVTFLEPNERNVNTVFQNYALFPHMNVFDNIAYGPKIKKHSKKEIKKRVGDMLELVQMQGYEKRLPHELSGGQRQRIAIARALVNKPEIVLLDEPLGALDLKLRRHMQSELRRIQKQTETVFIYVTHDQDEALNMSDRLTVMQNGVFKQIGTPEQIYNTPESRFVAEFVGDRNILQAKVIQRNGDRLLVELGGAKIEAIGDAEIGESIYIAVHSDRTILSTTGSLDTSRRGVFAEASVIEGVVTETIYIGSQTKTNVCIANGTEIKITEYNKKIRVEPGNKAYVSFNAQDGVVLKGE